MSEFINNREFRQKKLKELIMQLHEGKNFEEVKKEFQDTFEGVSASEIADLEQSIIMEGMPVEEVKRLCDVHASVFKGSIEDIHGNSTIRGTLGHPINTFIRENEALKRFIGVKFRFHIDLFKDNDSKETRDKLLKDIDTIYEVNKHYLRKENLLFPYLEKYGIYGPAKVMWGVDDDIRSDIKTVRSNIQNNEKSIDFIIEELEALIKKIEEMFFKEENILLPMAEDTLTQDEWLKIQDESDELGYTLIEKPQKWDPPRFTEDIENDKKLIDGNIYFETGVITVRELELVLNTLPFDITFIDKNDVVKYFSHGKERIFPRTKAVIGRTVQNCHPPSSVHIVNKMLEDFKNGKKEHEDFWIKMKGLFIYIRYFAIRDDNGDYIGTLEVTQNIKPLQQIEGEKRLLTE